MNWCKMVANFLLILGFSGLYFVSVAQKMNGRQNNVASLSKDDDQKDGVDSAHQEIHCKNFDPELVIHSLEKCVDENLDMDSYLVAYKQLYRFFQLLGTVFSFVASDINDKVNILEKYRKSETSSHYATFPSMIAYEKENDLLTNTNQPSGSRTLLRLHRALKFVSKFMSALSRADNDAKTSSIAQECYQNSLAEHHSWLIQKGAMLAMYALPNRRQLLEQVCNDKRVNSAELMGKLADVSDQVFNLTEKLYVENGLTELP